MTLTRMSLASCSSSTSSECWVESTTASIAHRPVVLVVLDGDLGLPVGAEVRQRAVLAHLRELLGQGLRDLDRQREQLGRVVAGVAEHQALVTGALAVELVARAVDALLEGVVDALRDVGRLGADRDLTPQELPSKPFSEES